jgi:hypothetical protein
MSKLTSAAVVVALATGLAIVGTGPTASAATTPGATISLIPTVTAPYHGSVAVRPRVKAKGQAVIAKSSLTVKRGTKTVVRSAAAPRLAAGTYTVTTTATYRPYSLVTTKKTVKERVVAVPEGSQVRVSCQVTGVSAPWPNEATFSASCKSATFDGAYAVTGSFQPTYDDQYEPVAWTGWLDQGSGAIVITAADADPSVAVGQTFSDIMYPNHDLYKTKSRVVTTTSRKYGPAKSTSRRQTLVVRAGAKPRTCATYADFKRVRYDFTDPSRYGSSSTEVRQLLHTSGTRSSFTDFGDYIIEFRHYKTCTKGDDITVGFVSGYAYDKTYWS